MIYLHVGCNYCKNWDDRFEYILQAKNLDYRKIHLNDWHRIRTNPEKDLLIGRANEFNKISPKTYWKINKKFKHIWPSFRSYYFYDDKWKQCQFLQRNKFPIPISGYVKTNQDTSAFLTANNLDFPIVQKKTYGSSSKYVSLAKNFSDIDYPAVLQEFCENNDGDIRMMVIGDRVFGLKRFNKENFKASGSRNLSEFNPLPCTELLYNLCAKHGFETMSFDLVKNKGKWVIVEMSCIFGMLNNLGFGPYCKYWIDMKLNKKIYAPIIPQDMVMDDFLKYL